MLFVFTLKIKSYKFRFSNEWTLTQTGVQTEWFVDCTNIYFVGRVTKI